MYLDINTMSLDALEELLEKNEKEDIPCVMENFYKLDGEPFRFLGKKYVNRVFIKGEIQRRSER